MSVLLESAGLGMVHLVKREMEFACDVAALRAFGSDCKKAYALTLLDMAQRNPKLVPLCSGFAKSSAEQRILAVLHFRRCKGWDGICTELMFALPTGVLATQASTPVQPVAEVVRETVRAQAAQADPGRRVQQIEAEIVLLVEEKSRRISGL